MRRDIGGWHSPRLNKWMDIVSYGHYGPALLLFPTAAADFLEYERFQLIDALRPFIDAGKLKVYSINSINTESWMNNQMNPRHKAERQEAFNHYIYDEVVPFIFNDCGGHTPIILSGASFGALHSANIFFKRPDLFWGLIAMSGDYQLHSYTKGYSDDLTFFNSPLSYLPGWNDHYIIDQLKQKEIVLATGQGNHEKPSAAIELSHVLNAKGIHNHLEVWGHDIHHDWPTWRQMLPHFLGNWFIH
ncbi:esterase family protein [Flammeovirga kamogawensis]|uniref:Esterase n=1 Tax=Flammeovirga kamogawensis TaxID=373891 RepID=A0ABX8GX53_9BACT|nr:alpha/beta hydrolase-fold protein [Flammeovirga kamogawensis]MBB6460810.1 esterase/lipase superfamily enzyme [Flammeovirga kamogawensis]QWG08161.1 esterase [Flammeovirga kamogawensis]